MTDLDPRALRALVGTMPKAELHLHLDGSLRVETALDIARTRGLDAPRTYEAMRRILVGPEQCEDHAQLLLAFDLPIELMQDSEAIERTAADLVEDKAFDHVRYVEIRWAPLLHTAQGMDGRQVVEAVARGARGVARRCGVEIRLIATLMRSHEP
jgi:adenosine deaminase